MTVNGLHDFWVSHDRKIILQKYAFMVFGGIMLGTITPYETSNIPYVFWRYVYWVGCVVFPTAISGMVGRAAFPWLRSRTKNVWAVFLGYTLVLAFPTYIWVGSWELILKGMFVYEGSFTEYVSQSRVFFEFGPVMHLGFYLRVWIITLILVGAISLFAVRFAGSEAVQETPEPQNPFLDRLPAELGRDLMCLSMEDHYVRAHTSEGDTLILMRMADAVKELSGYEGAQVHRSWWVASSAIEQVEKQPRKISLHLKNGLEVPVSQRRVKTLKEAGFL